MHRGTTTLLISLFAVVLIGCTTIRNTNPSDVEYNRVDTIQSLPVGTKVVVWENATVEIRIDRSRIERTLRLSKGTKAKLLLAILSENDSEIFKIPESDTETWHSFADFVFEILETGHALVVDRRRENAVSHILFNYDYNFGDNSLVAWQIFYLPDESFIWKTLYLIS